MWLIWDLLSWPMWRLSEDIVGFFEGLFQPGADIKDLTWFNPNATEILLEEWQTKTIQAFGLLLAGNAITEMDERGKPILGDGLMIILNAH